MILLLEQNYGWDKNYEDYQNILFSFAVPVYLGASYLKKLMEFIEWLRDEWIMDLLSLHFEESLSTTILSMCQSKY